MNAIKLYIGILIVGAIWLFSDMQKVYTLFTQSQEAKHYLILASEQLEEKSEKKLKAIDNILALKNEGAREYYSKYSTLKNESVDSILTIVDKYGEGHEGYFGFDKCNGVISFQKHKLISKELRSIVEDFENRLNYYRLSSYVIDAICASAGCSWTLDELKKDIFNDSVYYFMPVENTNSLRLLLEINGLAIEDYVYYMYPDIKKTKEIDIKYTILTLEGERTRIDTTIKRRRVSLEF